MCYRIAFAAIALVTITGACSDFEAGPDATPEQLRLVERSCREWRNDQRDLKQEHAQICIDGGYGK